jgi:hypothetical protein
MKKTAVLSLIVCLSHVAHAEQFVARPPRVPRAETTAPAAGAPRVGGGFANAARTGNALQAVNPRAPREYGTGEQEVYRDKDDTATATRQESRPLGLRLLSFFFW